MDQPHYFDANDNGNADYDGLLRMCKAQGYVPETCLLGGQMVLGLVNEGADPCYGCSGPREICHGRNKVGE